MKSRVCCAVISLAFAVMILGCSGKLQDKPLPMTQDNIKEYAEAVEKELKDIDMMSQDRGTLIVGAYKKAMEKKMRYSFDKTFRNILLFHGEYTQLISPAISIIIESPQDALNKGFISQRTFDILDMRKKIPRLTKEKEEFLGYVVECQNQNQGVCNPKALLDVLRVHMKETGKLDGVSSSEEMFIIDSSAEMKYDIKTMGSTNLITKPDGTKIDTNGLLLSRDATCQFIVNQSQIDMAKQYTAMLAEEEVALSK